MLVYDITNVKSFENIKNWIRNVDEVRNGVGVPTTWFYACSAW